MLISWTLHCNLSATYHKILAVPDCAYGTTAGSFCTFRLRYEYNERYVSYADFVAYNLYAGGKSVMSVLGLNLKALAASFSLKIIIIIFFKMQLQDAKLVPLKRSDSQLNKFVFRIKA